MVSGWCGLFICVNTRQIVFFFTACHSLKLIVKTSKFSKKTINSWSGVVYLYAKSVAFYRVSPLKTERKPISFTPELSCPETLKTRNDRNALRLDRLWKSEKQIWVPDPDAIIPKMLKTSRFQKMPQLIPTRHY